MEFKITPSNGFAMCKSLGILFSLLCFSVLLYGQSPRNVGVNLAEISPYASQIMFKDVMKQCSDWYACDTNFTQFHYYDVGGTPVNIPVDSNGYPEYAPFEINGQLLVPHVTMLNNQPDPFYYPSGNYTLIFEGVGRVRVHWDDVQGGQQDLPPLMCLIP